MKVSIALLVPFVLLHFSCTEKKQNAKRELEFIPNSLTEEIIEDTVSIKGDLFKERVDSLLFEVLSSEGFTIENEDTLSSELELAKHWWLKIFQRHRKDSSLFPTERDYQDISSIRQIILKKNWKIYIEEWSFKTAKDAKKWLEIANRTDHLDDHKPPREYWLEGDKLYFIMMTAAHDWFEYGDQSVLNFSGKKRFLLRLFANPLNLKAYKKGNGANSGPRKAKSYYVQPDTIGTFYDYFWFHKLRTRYPNESFQGLNIRTYIYGPDIGEYETVVEELIAVKSRLEDRDLKNLNLVGRERDIILEFFGVGLEMEDDDLIVYQHHGALLILHFEVGKVDWFNYIRTNLDLKSIIDLPEELKYFEEKIPNQSN